MPERREGSRASGLLPWLAVALAVVLIPNWFPAEQLFRTGGLLYYANAFDEVKYLSYDGSVATQSPTRLAQFLVTGLHRAGLSAGWINLALDLIAALAILLFVGRALRTLDFSESESAVGALVVVSAPVLFGYANPYWAQLFDASLKGGWISWVSMPQAFYPPFFRSPEPQLSWVVVAAAAYLAVRRRSMLPLFVILPFLYLFVSVPLALLLVSCAAHRLLRRHLDARPVWLHVLSIAGAFLLVALALVVMRHVLARTPDERLLVEALLVETRMPLLSVTSVIAFALYVAALPLLDARFRVALGYLAATPMLAVNTQTVTGFISQPSNFEQNFGTAAIAVIAAVAASAAVRRARWSAAIAAASGVALLCLFSRAIYAFNDYPLLKENPPPALLETLRRQSEFLLVKDSYVAALLSMLYPRQPETALSRVQAYPATAPASIHRYLCLKRRLASEPALYREYAATLSGLDRAYRYLGADFVLMHNQRKSRFKAFHDPDLVPTDCPRQSYAYYPARVLGPPIEGLYRLAGARVHAQAEASGQEMLAVVTPSARWAYAVSFTMDRGQTPQGPVLVRVTANVTRGCVGFGLLDTRRNAFDQEDLRTAGAAAPEPIDLVATRFSREHELIIRNCSPDGSSLATVHGVQAFSLDPDRVVGLLPP